MALRRSVRVYPPEEVTTISPDEVPAAEVGLAQDDVEAIWRSVVRFYKTGIQPAITLTIRRHGKIVLSRAVGHTHGNHVGAAPDEEKRLANPASLFNLFSGSKAITAMLIHHLDDLGLLHLDDAVVEYIPEFGKHRKEGITIRHLLSHRAGIPTTEEDIDLDKLFEEGYIRDAYCNARPHSLPGRRVAYHAVSAGFVLGDIIQAVTGKSINDYLTEVVREPLGFKNLTYGVPASRVDEVAQDTYTGFKQLPIFEYLVDRGFGGTMEEVVDLARDPRFLQAVVPSGNIIASSEEVSRFFEMLLRGGELDGVRVFDQRTVRRAVRETVWGEFDGILMLPIRYALGFMLGARYLSLYGLRTSKAFGHLGFSNVLAWADPERDISVCMMNNGKPLITPELVAWLAIPQTISSRIPRTFKGRTV